MESGRQRRIADAEWESHKATIYRLYVTENQTLSEVSDTMKTEHAFFAR
jgi:hypothetical protein